MLVGIGLDVLVYVSVCVNAVFTEDRGVAGSPRAAVADGCEPQCGC